MRAVAIVGSMRGLRDNGTRVEIRDYREGDVLISDGVRRGDRVVTDGCVLLEQMLD